MILVQPELPSHGDEVLVGKDIKQNNFEAIPHIRFKFQYFCSKRNKNTVFYCVWGMG